MDIFQEKLKDTINTLAKECVTDNIAEHVGLCVFYSNLYIQTKNEEYYIKQEKCISDILHILDRKTINCSIENGAAQILWLFDYLTKKELICISDDLLSGLRKSLNNQYRICLKENNWVYIRGALGCLHVIPSDENYSLFLDFFLQKFRGNSSIYSSWYSTETNLGLIYGILGILFFANRSFEYCSDKVKAQYLQQQVINLILHEYHANGFYPAMIGHDKCRMCWCYGELIMAYQLFMTGELMANIELKTLAIEIAEKTVECSTLQNTKIIDACLQHGAAGNYLLYNILYKKTRVDVFYKSAHLWLRYTKEILSKNNFKLENRYTGVLENDLSMLTGLTGIGLSLMDDDDWLTYVLLR